MLQILLIAAAALTLALYVGAIIAPRSAGSDVVGLPKQWPCAVPLGVAATGAIL